VKVANIIFTLLLLYSCQSCTQVDHDDRWNVLEASAAAQFRTGKYVEASMSYKEALKEAELLSDNMRQVNQSLSGLLATQLALQDYGAAEPTLVRMIHLVENSKPEKQDALQQKLVILAEIYEHLARYRDEAATYNRLAHLLAKEIATHGLN